MRSLYPMQKKKVESMLPTTQPDEDFKSGLESALSEELSKEFGSKSTPGLPVPHMPPKVIPARDTYEGARELKIKQLTEELQKFQDIESTISKEIEFRETELAEVQMVISALTASLVCLQPDQEDKASKKRSSNAKTV